jgi:hypothetical protein
MHSLSTRGRSQHDECVCCLAAILSCTRLPWSALAGVARRPEGQGDDFRIPLLGPVNASGLASYVFRRSAARDFGLHATPAPFFTLSGRGRPP